MATIRGLLSDLEAFEATPEGRGYDLRLSLADIVVRRLKENGWTQKRLADAAGMKPAFVTRIIHGDSNCTFEVAGRILHALGVKVELAETRRVPKARSKSRGDKRPSAR